MDGTKFDQLVKQLGSTRLTRLTALRGLAVGAVAALAGADLSPDSAAGKKGSTKKRKVCDCQGDVPSTCNTRRMSRKKRKQLLRRNPCAYPGKCDPGRTGCPGGVQPGPTPGPTPNPGTQCDGNEDCSGGLVCRGGVCDTCNNNNDCPGQLCVQDLCRGGPGDFAGECDPSDDPCPFPLECLEEEAGTPGDFFCFLPEMEDEDGDALGLCPPRDDEGECEVDADYGDREFETECVLGACVVRCEGDAEDACDDAGFVCRAGICYAPD